MALLATLIVLVVVAAFAAVWATGRAARIDERTNARRFAGARMADQLRADAAAADTEGLPAVAELLRIEASWHDPDGAA